MSQFVNSVWWIPPKAIFMMYTTIIPGWEKYDHWNRFWVQSLN